MHYRVREKINQRLDCNLLVVCTNHIVLCQVNILLHLLALFVTVIFIMHHIFNIHIKAWNVL